MTPWGLDDQLVEQSERLVERGDLDELTRQVDRLVERRAWAELLDLRDRCRRALERGKQLWPIASHIEYRLALQAPGRWAAATLGASAGHFALGPLPEVAASSHTWPDLAPHVSATPEAALTAHERVVRGEDLSVDETVRALPPVFELPLRLQAWEPEYALATYFPDRLELPSPTPPVLDGVPLRPAIARPGSSPAERLDDPAAVGALVELAAAWTAESNGRAEAVAVRGGAAAALATLGVPQVRVAPVDGATALAMMAWTAASGGAHGRRRGAAAGRFAAWWTLAALGGIVDDWPVPAEELGQLLEELRWYAWDAGEPATGWALRIAVEDPADGLAWALAATDAD
jgi:hypothetical protein